MQPVTNYVSRSSNIRRAVPEYSRPQQSDLESEIEAEYNNWMI